jgi:hypothetical protein
MARIPIWVFLFREWDGSYCLPYRLSAT